MARSPGTKASAARDLLAFSDKFAPGTRDEILQRMPDESRAFILEASRVAFLPIEQDHWIVDGLCDVLGTERAIACWRASIPDMVDKPLLRNLVSGMLRVFGSNRKKVVSLIPRAWELVYKDYCDSRVAEREATHSLVVFEDCAPQLSTYPNYFHSWHGVCLGVFDLAGLSGEVEWTVAPDKCSASARFNWRS